MLDFTVVEAVRNSLTEAVYSCSEIGATTGAIFAEVKNINRQLSMLPDYSGFVHQEVRSFGVDSEKYIDFLREHTHSNHDRLLNLGTAINAGWGTGWAYVDQCILQFPGEEYDYSIAVGVITEDNEKSQVLLKDIMRNIRACQPR